MVSFGYTVIIPTKYMKGCVLMFSNIKNRFNKKGKRAAALLVTAAMLCGFTGCGKSETGSSAVSSSSSEPQRVLADTSIFDFDEAVKNIILFGQKISLPCYWSDFGEDFSHDEMYISSDDDLMCDLQYKGKKIGNIFFGDCADTEDTSEAESHQIVCIVIGFTNYGYPYDEYYLNFFESLGYYTGQLELGVGNISMSSSESDVMAELGKPSRITEGGSKHYLDYNYDSGYFHFVINVNKIPIGITQLYIRVNQD